MRQHTKTPVSRSSNALRFGMGFSLLAIAAIACACGAFYWGRRVGELQAHKAQRQLNIEREQCLRALVVGFNALFEAKKYQDASELADFAQQIAPEAPATVAMQQKSEYALQFASDRKRPKANPTPSDADDETNQWHRL